MGLWVSYSQEKNNMEQQSILADHDRQFSWHNYNESQTREKVLFVNILADLCSLIEEREHQKGRKHSLYHGHGK